MRHLFYAVELNLFWITAISFFEVRIRFFSSGRLRPPFLHNGFEATLQFQTIESARNTSRYYDNDKDNVNLNDENSSIFLSLGGNKVVHFKPLM